MLNFLGIMYAMCTFLDRMLHTTQKKNPLSDAISIENYSSKEIVSVTDIRYARRGSGVVQRSVSMSTGAIKMLEFTMCTASFIQNLKYTYNLHFYRECPLDWVTKTFFFSRGMSNS